MRKKSVALLIVILSSLTFVSCNKPKENTEVAAVNGPEEQYVEVMSEKAEEMANHMETFEYLSANVELTDEWKAEVVKVSTNISELSIETNELEAPDSYLESHKIYIKALETMLESLTYYLTGVAETDLDKIEKSYKLWVQTGELMVGASEIVANMK